MGFIFLFYPFTYIIIHVIVYMKQDSGGYEKWQNMMLFTVVGTKEY